jgi:GAF domain-containing protein
VHLRAFHGATQEATEAMKAAYPIKLGRGAVSARAIRERAPVQIADVLEDPEYELKDASRAAGYKSGLAVPMFREGRVIGSIGVTRTQPGAFPARLVQLLQTFAEQAVIAIENVRLFNETQEALGRQTATADVLRVISSSPTDVHPVFDAIVRTALRLLSCDSASFLRCDGKTFSPVVGAHKDGTSMKMDSSDIPVDPAANFPSRVMVTKTILHVPDWSAVDLTPQQQRVYDKLGVRSSLMLPLLRDDECIGVLALGRKSASAFTETEIALAKSFVDQALIAIENTRLFNETKEALDQQRASGEVLAAISNSIADTAPVFATILDSCERLFSGNVAGVSLVGDDGLIHLRAYHGLNRAELEKVFPLALDETSGSGACIVSRSVVHYPDTEDESVPEATRRACRATGHRSVIFAPMVWEGRGIGVIFVGRAYAGSFSEKDMALLRTFADQAVIAIQNSRLFNETNQALERQIATADILRVIASSPSEVQPVLDAIVRSAAQLFGRRATIRLAETGGLRRKAISDGTEPGFYNAELLPINRESLLGVAVLDRQAMQVEDTHSPSAPPYARGNSGRLRWRAMASAPLMREDAVLGVLTVSSESPGLMTDKQMALLKTFADQAVIAIQNARLFNETKEALEQQTATAEVLQVISSSVADTQPVFDKILDSCQHLFATEQLGIFLAGDDGMVHVGAWRGVGDHRRDVPEAARRDDDRGRYPRPPHDAYT